jgi:hypothetical protein
VARDRSQKRLLAGAVLFLAGALTWALLGSVISSGASALHYADFSAPAFTPIEYSTHNHGPTSACGGEEVDHPTGPDTFQGGAENHSDLDAKKGSYLENVRLGQGATVKKLTVFANDNDGDHDLHVYLVRKRVGAGLNPRFQGYKVMARADSSGAVLDTMRKFTDATIVDPVIDNEHFFYFLEMVNCGTIEPFAAQIAFNG